MYNPKVALAKRKELKPFNIDPQKHVKLWISRDGIPAKHQARFIRFRALNPNASFYLIYVDKYLTESARREMMAFANKLTIQLIKYEDIKARNEDEVAIKAWMDHEIKFYFEEADPELKGNLSVVSDQLRLMTDVIKLGIMTDCDVEYATPLPEQLVEAPLGFIARQKEQGTRVSNDLTAGDPDGLIFQTARRLVCIHNDLYHKNSVPSYFRRHRVTFDPNDYKNHPFYYEARNLQLEQFSLGGGPQLFAVALNLCGVATGYETTQNEILILTSASTFAPYTFLKVIKDEAQTAIDFKLQFPEKLGRVMSHWDTSWMPGQHSWKRLTLLEEIRLTLFYRGMDADINLLTAENLIYQRLLQPAIFKSLSYLKNYLALFFTASLKGKRHRAFAELPGFIQEYIECNETPSEQTRQYLRNLLGSNFAELANKLDKQGVLVLPSFVDGEALAVLQHAYETEVDKKDMHALFNQLSVSVAADVVTEDFLDAALAIGNHPQLQALVHHHFGQAHKLTAMRGYRQAPAPACRYRAWDWHHDNKAQGPNGEIKIMILLNGVEIDGQAMRYALGTHQYHWRSERLSQTKYNIDEALTYSQKQIQICHGAPGTVIIFDTNGIHSGWRNLEGTRDVITITYTPAREQCPEMFAVPESAKVKLTDYSKALFFKAPNSDVRVLKPQQISKLKESYSETPLLVDLKDRYREESAECLAKFIARVAFQDMNDDLDLPLRVLGTTVIERDNQLVKFRDASATHIQYQRLNKRLIDATLKPNDWIDIQTLKAFANTTAELIAHTSIEIVRCAHFARDLGEAFGHIDSIQRLRTQTIFLYFTLDKVAEVYENVSGDEKHKFSDMADQTLAMYVNMVFLDDLNDQLEHHKSSAHRFHC